MTSNESEQPSGSSSSRGFMLPPILARPPSPRGRQYSPSRVLPTLPPIGSSTGKGGVGLTPRSPILPSMPSSAPVIPTKGSLSPHPPPLSTSSSWSGFSILDHNRPVILPSLPLPAPVTTSRITERYDSDQADRFKLFRQPPPLSFTGGGSAGSATTKDGTRHSSESSTAASVVTPEEYGNRRRLPPSPGRPTHSHHQDGPEERAYKRLKPSPESTSAAPVPLPPLLPPPPPPPLVSNVNVSMGVAAGGKERLDPKHAFALLKGYYYDKPFAAVGLEGPANLQELVRAARNEVAEVEGGGKDKGGNKDVWPDDAEYAFLAAEALLGDEVTSKVQFFGKQSGRNEIIALIISMAIGKLMTRKQVSSHLQVVRQRKNVHAKVKALMDRNYGEGHATTAQTSLRLLSPELYEIIGIPVGTDLSERPKPAWISHLEAVHPGAEYSNTNKEIYSEGGIRRNPSGSPPKQQRPHATSYGGKYASRTESSGTSPSASEAGRSRLMEIDELEGTPRLGVAVPRQLPARHANPPDIRLDYLTLQRGDTIIISADAECKKPLPYRRFSSIPQSHVRYKGLEELARTYGCCVVHVDATVDTAALAEHLGDIHISLGLFSPFSPHPNPAEVFVATTSGYLVGSYGTMGIVHISDVDSVRLGREMVYRPTLPYAEQRLPTLVREQPHPNRVVIPQYWIMQEVFTTGFEKQVLVGSRLSEGHSMSPAAVAAEEIALVVIYSLTGGTNETRSVRIENVRFD